jgi:hypothetical protein
MQLRALVVLFNLPFGAQKKGAMLLPFVVQIYPLEPEVPWPPKSHSQKPLVWPAAFSSIRFM